MTDICNIQTSGRVIVKDDTGNVLCTEPNLVVRSSADVMSKLIGRAPGYSISHIGFIYGSDAQTPTVSDTWPTVTGHHDNIILTPISPVAAYEASTSSYDYNTVQLTALSDKEVTPLQGTPPVVDVDQYTHLVLVASYYKPSATSLSYDLFSYKKLNTPLDISEGRELNVVWELVNTKEA